MPFPSDSVEFMHHTHIYDYAKKYAETHDILKNILFQNEVILIEGNQNPNIIV
jgi:hypothetical protein